MIFQKNYFILCYYFLFFIYVNGDIITNECSDSIHEGLIFTGNSSNQNITFFCLKHAYTYALLNYGVNFFFLLSLIFFNSFCYLLMLIIIQNKQQIFF